MIKGRFPSSVINIEINNEVALMAISTVYKVVEKWTNY
jgi:hypothetical protein